MSYQDRMAEDADWKDSMNAFREQTQERILALLDQINELELSIEAIANPRKSGNKEG